MENAIFSLVGKVPTRLSSHNAGWAYKWADVLGADIVNDFAMLDNYENIYLFNSPNDKIGAINLFGFKLDNDVGTEVQARIGAVNDSVVNLRQLDFNQTFHTTLSKRGLRIPFNFDQVTAVEQWKLKSKVVIGDSHSPSIAGPGWCCHREDGKSLFGALKQGLLTRVPRRAEMVAFNFGNIDMRHHLGRQEDPHKATLELVHGYISQVQHVRKEEGAYCFITAVSYTHLTLPTTPYV